jgi:hypothetical protein
MMTLLNRLLLYWPRLILMITPVYIYILGDFNFPYINCGTVSDTQDSGSANDFCDLVNNYFLTQVVDAPTRYSGQ